MSSSLSVRAVKTIWFACRTHVNPIKSTAWVIRTHLIQLGSRQMRTSSTRALGDIVLLSCSCNCLTCKVKKWWLTNVGGKNLICRKRVIIRDDFKQL